MKRERALQVVLVFYSLCGYILFDDLWHLRWLSGHSDVMPMFLSLNTALGICLVVAAKQPAKHRLMIAYGAWSSLDHGINDDNHVGAGRGARDAQERIAPRTL
jgi:hypothetical protein